MIAFTDSDCEACPTRLQGMAASVSEPGTALVLGGRHHAAESLLTRVTVEASRLAEKLGEGGMRAEPAQGLPQIGQWWR